MTERIPPKNPEIIEYPENYEEMKKKYLEREDARIKVLLERHGATSSQELTGTARKSIDTRAQRASPEHKPLKDRTILRDPKSEDIHDLKKVLEKDVSAVSQRVLKEPPERISTTQRTHFFKRRCIERTTPLNKELFSGKGKENNSLVLLFSFDEEIPHPLYKIFMKDLNQDSLKKAVGEKAASLIENGMLVGLGTGSTATFFIDSLIKRCKSGLKISAIATSSRSLLQAKQGGISILDSTRVTQLDITVDGADEIDPQNRMIKGGGGALVREKILASSSKKMVVIVDESKLVNSLGKFGLPVEIIPFCYLATLAKIRKAGFDGKMRYAPDGSHYVTDNGNYIFDIQTPQLFHDPDSIHHSLKQLPGVVETGLFLNLPVQLLVGYKDGSSAFREEIQRKSHG